MNKAGDRHEFFLHNGILGQCGAVLLHPPLRRRVLRVFQLGHFAVEAKAVAVRQINIKIVITGTCTFQPGGDVLRTAHVFHFIGTGDVVVVGDTAVLVHFEEIVIVGGMHLVFLADIASKHACVEVRGGLVGIIAAPVKVVDVEADGQPLVDVDGEVGLEAILTVDFATRLIVGQVGERYVAVGEEQVTGLYVKTGQGSNEDCRIFIVVPLEENARLTGRAEVAQVVVVPLHTFHQISVLEVQTGCIRRNKCPLAQFTANFPHVEFRRQALDIHSAVL